ncbi:hypothetical protein GINT2_001619 [Glugoides intestinalis]
MCEQNAQKRFENEATILTNEERPEDITVFYSLNSKKQGDRRCSVDHKELNCNLAFEEVEKPLEANKTFAPNDEKIQKIISVENYINPYFYGTKLEGSDGHNELKQLSSEATDQEHAKLFLHFINKVKEKKSDQLLSTTAFYHQNYLKEGFYPRDENFRDGRRFSWIGSQPAPAGGCIPFSRMYPGKMRLQANNHYYRGISIQQEILYQKRPEEHVDNRYYGEGFRAKSRAEKKAAIIKAKKFIEKQKTGESELIDEPRRLDGGKEENEETQ